MSARSQLLKWWLCRLGDQVLNSLAAQWIGITCRFWPFLLIYILSFGFLHWTILCHVWLQKLW